MHAVWCVVLLGGCTGGGGGGGGVTASRSHDRRLDFVDSTPSPPIVYICGTIEYI